jgi:hypothetical protein
MFKISWSSVIPEESEISLVQIACDSFELISELLQSDVDVALHAENKKSNTPIKGILGLQQIIVEK